MVPGQGATLPRYYFAVRWPDRTYEDETGAVLSNDDDARVEACRIIRALKEDGYGNEPKEYGDDNQNIEMIVKNEDGDVIYILPF